jgi:nanoRNase/pAp phosphatase (c-di-AMP/oligoRNAs hydrolase)
MGEKKKYRLVTRSDFDGLVAGAILKELDLIDDVKFVHPKDMQDGKVDITENDITTNLPFVEGVHLAFDHHLSEIIRVGERENLIIDPDAPSAARVVYNYYGGEEALPNISPGMLQAVDKADSAQFVKEDVLYPNEWELLNFIMDPRTGLGRFKHFRISNYELMMDLIDYCRFHEIEDILDLPDVRERVDLYYEYQEQFQDQLKRCTTVHNNLLVVDLREEEIIYPGNRFMLYVLYPDANISMHVLWGREKQNTVFAVGKSIFNRTSKTFIGALMLQYGGGGHASAGTCQIENEKAEQVKQELIEKITADG